MPHQNLNGTEHKFYSLLRLKNAYHTDTWAEGKKKKKRSTWKRTEKATLTKVDGRGLQHLLYDNLFIQPQCHDEGAGIVPSAEHGAHPAGCDVHLQLIGVKDHPLVQRVDHQTFCGCSCPFAPWSQRTDTSQPCCNTILMLPSVRQEHAHLITLTEKLHGDQVARKKTQHRSST